MPGTKCPTVRSTGPTSVRSALMPTLMKSRASMGPPPVVLDKRSEAKRRSRTHYPTEHCHERPKPRPAVTTAAWGSGSWLSPGQLRLQLERWLLLRSRRALHERLAALHLVAERGFIDLDDDGVGIDAEILHQCLGDVAHHAGLLFVGAAFGHADSDLRHFSLPWGRTPAIDGRHQTGGRCPGQARAWRRQRMASPSSRHGAPTPRALWRRGRPRCTRTAPGGSRAIPGWKRSRPPPSRPRSDP